MNNKILVNKLVILKNKNSNNSRNNNKICISRLIY